MGGRLFEAARRVYEGGGWPISAMEGEDGFFVDVEGEDGAWSALVITDDTGLFAFYSVAPVTVDLADAEAIARMAEFVDRANYGLISSTFEFDRDDGEVRLRSGMEFTTLPPEIVTDEVLEAFVLDLSAANVSVMNSYLTGLVTTVMGDRPVTEILADIEGED
ncbi:hypothetical protein [Nocardioides sp.]|uniref:hypothetical protein n=1 Tax=Nocardioides sp. TaxID=35761 RepID=UPI0035134AE1